MKPDGSNVEAKVLRILNEDGEEQESAPHSKQVLHVGNEIQLFDVIEMEKKMFITGSKKRRCHTIISES